MGASVVALSREGFSWRRDRKALLLGAALAMLPDLDLFFSWIMGYGIKWHGGFSHSILFAMMVGSVTVALMREGETRDILVYTMATLSHGLLDVITKKEFGGSQLLWPFSPYRYRLSLFSYFEFYPNPVGEPLGPIVERALRISFYEILIFAPVFATIVWWRSRRNRRVKAAPKIRQIDFEKGD
jgi:membrane-bound metal-dependent hydrolase YbcI (DUF457 family)